MCKCPFPCNNFSCTSDPTLSIDGTIAQYLMFTFHMHISPLPRKYELQVLFYVRENFFSALERKTFYKRTPGIDSLGNKSNKLFQYTAPLG